MERQLGHEESLGSAGSALEEVTQARSTSSPTKARLNGVSSDEYPSELAENASPNRPCHYLRSYSWVVVYRR
jgi:hypothetical protein